MTDLKQYIDRLKRDPVARKNLAVDVASLTAIIVSVAVIWSVTP